MVHDDLDLPPGTVRLKEGGGHGGHNGLRDIAAHLGTRDFARVRLGIGRPAPGRWTRSTSCSSGPRAEERRLIDDAIGQVLDWSAALLAGDLQPVMKALHTKQEKVRGEATRRPGRGIESKAAKPDGPRATGGTRTGRGDRAPEGAPRPGEKPGSPAA